MLECMIAPRMHAPPTRADGLAAGSRLNVAWARPGILAASRRFSCYNPIALPPQEDRAMPQNVLPPGTPLDDPALYINRELSWLEFNRRVLEEAQDPKVPLLERVKFLAIFESNLDEFFMVRVGGLQQKVQAGIAYGSGADHMPVKEQLERIGQRVRGMTEDAYRCLHNDVAPGLVREGIVLRGLKELTEAERKYLSEVFRREVFPVL